MWNCISWFDLFHRHEEGDPDVFFDVTYACFMMMIRQWLILVYFNGSLVKLQQFLSYVSYDVSRCCKNYVQCVAVTYLCRVWRHDASEWTAVVRGPKSLMQAGDVSRCVLVYWNTETIIYLGPPSFVHPSKRTRRTVRAMSSDQAIRYFFYRIPGSMALLLE